MSLRQPRRRAALRERVQRLARKEPVVRPLKFRNRVERSGGGRSARLRMAVDGARRLILQVLVPHVVHQRRIERGRVHSARHAAGENDRGGGGVIQEHHALGQFALDQNGGVRGDPAGAAEEVVEAIMNKQRIRRVLRQALGDFSRVDRPVIA